MNHPSIRCQSPLLTETGLNRPARVALATAVIAIGLLVCAPALAAETLLIERVGAQKSLSMPPRGLTMSDVEARYGAPLERLEPRGGQRPQWPVIHRWVYAEFTVYFEQSHVIDVVARKAQANETGPKPIQ